MGYDFENTLQTQKQAMSECTKCEISQIKEEQVFQEGLIYSENSKSKLKYYMYRAAYTVTALKKSCWYDNATNVHKKTQKIATFCLLKISQLKFIAGTQSVVTGTC